MDYDNRNEETLKDLVSGFATEDLEILKADIAEKKRLKLEEETRKVTHNSFKKIYDAALNDPDVAPFKELVEEVVKENPEFKDLGESGVKVVLKLAKERIKAQAKSNPANLTVDETPKGSTLPKTGSGNFSEKGIPCREDNLNLIDWGKVDLGKLDPVMRDFVELQRQSKKTF